MTQSLEIDLTPENNERLANLCGPFNKHLTIIENSLGVEISNRNHHFQLIGEIKNIHNAVTVLEKLYAEAEHDLLSPSSVNMMLQECRLDDLPSAVVTNPDHNVNDQDLNQWNIQLRKSTIKGRGVSQLDYLQHIQTSDVTLGVGPAGTGKTYLAVACAVAALEAEKVHRLVLVRPAVEAGERLGFLPGDLAQKIDPYLRPMYDALYEMLGFERVGKLIERHIIEVAPLAYMRGRTLNDAFIILDEAQNTTREQMKMFLTRVGFGSTVVVTGDVTQVDLPVKNQSGLRHAIEVLKDVEGVAMTFFTARDVVRHPMVQQIVKAYEKAEQNDNG